jgi:hypothetical protein
VFAWAVEGAACDRVNDVDIGFYDADAVVLLRDDETMAFCHIFVCRKTLAQNESMFELLKIKIHTLARGVATPVHINFKQDLFFLSASGRE